jgi:hypothetical protein
MKIIHTYGIIYSPHFLLTNGIPYGESITGKLIIDAANNIEIMNIDKKEYTKGINDARKAIGDSKAIWFLGFGFHEENIRRLFKNTFINDSIYIIDGSGYGMGSAERERAAYFIKSFGKFDRVVIKGIEDTDILGYFKNFWDSR